MKREDETGEGERAAQGPGDRPLRLARADVVAPLRLATRPFAPPADGRWTGALLRAAREARGLSILQLAERTKVTRHHIENLEAERHEGLPAPVYLRGILSSIAKELRLDGAKVSRSYLHAMQARGDSGREN